jgi:hypothetical protein
MLSELFAMFLGGVATDLATQIRTTPGAGDSLNATPMSALSTAATCCIMLVTSNVRALNVLNKFRPSPPTVSWLDVRTANGQLRIMALAWLCALILWIILWEQPRLFCVRM